MWLKRARIVNFRSAKDVEVDFSHGINAIFGENGTGKSNLVKAILKILGPRYPGSNSFTIEDHYLRDPSNDIEIALVFEDGGVEKELAWRTNRLWLDGHGVNDGVRQQFCPLHFPADREIDEVPGHNTWNPIGRILAELAEMVQRNATFQGDFARRVSELNATLESAPEFASFKAGLGRFSQDHLGTRGRGIQVELGLVDPQQVLRTLRIFESSGSILYNIADGGQGVQSSVTMAALRAFSEVSGGRLFLIADEPEAFLHPLAQRALRSVFEGIASAGSQVILTTHSPHFISVRHLEGLHKVWMESGETRVMPFSVQKLLDQRQARGIVRGTPEGVKSRLTRALTLEAGEALFAQLAVVCEGETESLALPVWSEASGHDLAKEGIAVVQAQGKFSMIQLVEFYTTLDIPVYVVFDSDSGRVSEKEKHAEHNRWLLAACGAHVEDFPSTAIGPSCAVFSPDFERVMRTDPAYSGAEAVVDFELGLEAGGSKGIRARFVAMKYLEDRTPVPDVMARLVNAIVDRRAQATPRVS
jgi:putative ATP-dependent endonuclease of the OLD family